MASSTRDIKRKIKSVNSTMQITKAFELVSTAKLKRARDRLDATKPYFETLQGAVDEALGADRAAQSRYLESEAIKKPLYILVTSDRGLCGGYNINASKAALDTETEAATYIAVGKKGAEFLAQQKCEISETFLYISERPEFHDAAQVAKVALELYDSGAVDAIILVYTRFMSTISQVPTQLRLLPIERMTTRDSGGEIEDEVVSYEPSPEAVIAHIVPKYVESTIYGGLVESSASEQAARRIAMENASDNAEEIIDELTLSFNRARQAAITQEISEIVGGAEALK